MIGKYQITDKIGQGGSSKVYKASEPCQKKNENKKIALKVMNVQ
jgi:serine/threonine protein kinase